MTIPIFVISYNRGRYLKRVIDSYRRQTVPVEIIIHDFGSTEPSTLSVLKELEKSGIKVARAARIFNGNQLNETDRTVQEYFSDKGAHTRYVVTDCDIDLTVASADSLSIYNQLLDRLPEAECAGPMLRIIDVPQSFPLYSRVMNRHIEQFWHRQPEWIELQTGTRIAYLCAPIDTSFALHRENQPFQRQRQGVRVYFPYEAQHLDWYQTAADLEQSEYFRSSFEGIGNWSNKVSHARFTGSRLDHNEFFYVTAGIGDKLECRRKKLAKDEKL